MSRGCQSKIFWQSPRAWPARELTAEDGGLRIENCLKKTFNIQHSTPNIEVQRLLPIEYSFGAGFAAVAKRRWKLARYEVSGSVEIQCPS
jgi:hypothetical protein